MQRRHRRIDAAAQRADDAAVADLRADPRRRLLDKRRHRPVAGAAADAVREVAQDLEAALGVRRLRDGTAARRAAARRPPSPRPARWRWSRRPRSPAGAAATKSPWLAQTRISAGTSAKSAADRGLALRPPIVTVAWPNSRCGAGATRAAERVRHQLHAVADAEHRAAEVEERRIALRRAGVGHALRSARQDDAGRIARARIVSAGVSGGQISE